MLLKLLPREAACSSSSDLDVRSPPIMRKEEEEKFPSVTFRVRFIFLSTIQANTRALVCIPNMTAI